MNEITYDSIKLLAKKSGCSVKELYVLSAQNDPFYCGSPTDLADAEWFGDLWTRFQFPSGVHLRRIHYLLISQETPISMRNGKPYQNTEDCWKALTEASKRARYLGVVRPGAFEDRRNPPPTIYHANEIELAGVDQLNETPYIASPYFPLLPSYELTGPFVDQRYHMEVWCEKSTMDDVLNPLCREFGVNYVTGVGELSITAVIKLIFRARHFEKPVRLFYVSDFDPAGKSMPVAVARKAEFFIRRDYPDIDLRLYPVVLTEQQIFQYRLPRTPIKESERRRAAFEERNGAGATELDALEALHPGELRQILTSHVSRYYDTALSERVSETRRHIRAELSTIRNEVIARHADNVDALKEEYERIGEMIEGWHTRAAPVWQAISSDLKATAPDIYDYELPEPEMADELDEALFDSGRDYLDQIAHYKRFQGKADDD